LDRLWRRGTAEDGQRQSDHFPDLINDERLSAQNDGGEVGRAVRRQKRLARRDSDHVPFGRLVARLESLRKVGKTMRADVLPEQLVQPSDARVAVTTILPSFHTVGAAEHTHGKNILVRPPVAVDARGEAGRRAKDGYHRNVSRQLLVQPIDDRLVQLTGQLARQPERQALARS
jgi:hypothetical protein